MINDQQQGFTLLEVLLALAVFSLLLLVSGTIFSYTLNSWQGEKEYLTGEQKGGLILNEITYHLRRGRDIEVNTDNNSQFLRFRGFDHRGAEMWFHYGIYHSQGIPALGLKTSGTGGESGEFSYYSPLANGIEDLEVVDIKGDLSLLEVVITLTGGGVYRTLIAPAGERVVE